MVGVDDKDILCRKGATPNLAFKLGEDLLDLDAQIYLFFREFGSVVQKQSQDVFCDQDLAVTVG